MHHTNDLVISCIDFRFRPLVNRWIETHLHGQADLAAMAGASKAILDHDSRPVLLNQIKIARDLHDINTVHLMDHVDCGAYGGSGQHIDKLAELTMHRRELAAAATVIEQAFPTLAVKSYVVDFDAVMQI